MKQKQNIIFLHGITGNRNAFQKEYEYLKDTYNCLWYDFPGYGDDTLGVDLPFTLDLLVEQLDNEYTKAGIESAHICTLSFGCLPAMAFAHKYPEKVDSLMFSGGYCNVPSQFQTNLKYLIESKEEYSNEDWVKQYGILQNPNNKAINEDCEAIFFKYGQLLHPNVFEKAVRIQLEFDSEKVLKAIKCPILWVMGEYDNLYKGTLYKVNEWAPHVVYKELKGAGHVAHIHEPKQFMVEYEAFLRNITNQESRLATTLI
ncbi:alpha/beta hydrolase [Bacillus luti]|nr:alpha/beta hydrolase [Bacillus cereus]HDR8330914.1 alpha/beta hydrolase [Bacillus cereus]HDR8335941.1 alpha/beta hydrolase [Bacillus cereus]